MQDITEEEKKSVPPHFPDTVAKPPCCQGDKAQPSLAENIVLATLAFNTH